MATNTDAAIQGPWWADEAGTFNAKGWGFRVLVPDEWADYSPDDWPDEVHALAAALEQTIRDHLSRKAS